MMWLVVVGVLFVGVRWSLLGAGLVVLLGYAASCWAQEGLPFSHELPMAAPRKVCLSVWLMHAM
jgi:hypothetical protein